MTTSPTTPRSEPGTESAVDRFGPLVALIAAIGLTASGEFQLAMFIGFPQWIAWAFPVAVDVYVVQAIRRHRDVPGAIALMIATNGLYHLAAAGLVGVDSDGRPLWWLIVGVVAIAPMIVWRVHRITETPAPATEAAAGQIPVSDTTPRSGATREDATRIPAVLAMAPPVASEPATVAGPVAPPGYATPRHSAPATGVLVAPQHDAPERLQGGATKATRKTLRKNAPTGTRSAAKEAIRGLYDSLGRRPLESEMVSELIRTKSPHTSRQFANKIRKEIEKTHPELAALGSENVRPLTGTEG